MFEFDAILLAAGLSSRMGAENKLLLDVGGQPMIRHMAQTYLGAIDGPVTVITGHDADRVADALSGLPVTLCHNPDFQTGQPSSVATGLRRSSMARATLIGLGDQPSLSAANLAQFTRAHMAADQMKVSVPDRNGTRGNPIIVPANLRPRLLENKDKPGCMRFTRDHPEHVQRLSMRADGFFADIDTPDAYAALQSQMKGAAHAMAHD